MWQLAHSDEGSFAQVAQTLGIFREWKVGSACQSIVYTASLPFGGFLSGGGSAPRGGWLRYVEAKAMVRALCCCH